MFAITIAYATFIENDYGTSTAQVLIYQAWWFEILLFLGIVNLSGSVIVNKLFTKKKWAILMFHLAFILIIVGAGVTRYFGFEGSMHIREGEETNEVVSESNYIGIKATFNNEVITKQTQVKFTSNSNADYDQTITIGGKQIHVKKEIFIPRAVETIEPDGNGVPIISLMVGGNEVQPTNFLLMPNEKKEMASVSFGFETGDGSATVVFSRNADGLTMVVADTLLVSSMHGEASEKLPPLVAYPVFKNKYYILGKSGFVFKDYLPKAIPALTQVPMQSNVRSVDAFTAVISSGDEVRKVNVLGGNGTIHDPASCILNGVKVELSYGATTRKLPFSIFLRDFQLERYPGSNSPSSYASEITLNDPSSSLERPYRIFMNNILNYKGYRLFHSSFDQDEKGTVLTVNQDYWGTFITYWGYFLMIVGMIFTVFSKSSRFQTLIRLSSKLQAERRLLKVLVIGLILTVWGFANQSVVANNSNKENHLRAFGKLLVQDHQGRIEPVNTLASDLLRKISKENNWQGRSAVEFLLDMSSDPEKWKTIPIVKVANTELQKVLGLSDDLISFNQMFDQAGNYRLNDLVQQSYNKQQTHRNKFDKEIINVDERVNICFQIFNGDFLKIFPVPQDERKTWITSTAIPQSMNEKDAAFVSGIMKIYYSEVINSKTSGNWSKADEYLEYIKKYQHTFGADIIPSQTKIDLEIFYNEWNIFGKLAKTYALLGFVLLLFHFVLIFRPAANLNKFIYAGIGLISFAFLLYTTGLVIRWYISGHAPWSNGYETMLYVGWATSLSGFIFVRRSPITLAVTTILTSIILFVAGMSWMNPEITNLVPVLKSYWLIVHVAIITASYGFLALAALLGMLNLVLMILRNPGNEKNIGFTILEVSYIIELAMIIGLLMLTIGCFIGGIWANESWGRYWGWDPKETWALVTVLVYSIILHLRKIPGLKSIFALSSLSLVGLASVLMTFFGVNYYLSGMHSYAQGDPPPIPNVLYVAIGLIFLLVLTANYRWNKTGGIKNFSENEVEE